MTGQFGRGTFMPIPSKNEVGHLDPSIFGEGIKVEVDSNVPWSPPPPTPVMPDWSNIKSIRKYFGRTEHPAWPAWFYHPTHEPVLCTEDMAAHLGIRYREATFEEKGRYGTNYVWDYEPGCEWSSRPYPGNLPARFDPKKPAHGKNYVPAAPNPQLAQNALIAELIPTVTAAVVTALKSGGQAGTPANVDQAQWDEFLAFKAWKETQRAVEGVASSGGVLNAGDRRDERAEWEEAANRIGLKVDGRWSLERLKTEVEKKAAELEAAKADAETH